MLKKLLVLLCVSIVGLVVLEFATRIVFSDIGSTGDNTSYFARRWRAEHPPAQNVLGFRERDFDPVAQPAVYRIAVVGDSFIYGQGVLEFERLTNRLEAGLTAAGPYFEVLNFGEPGADYEENTINAALAITSSHPDYVLLSWFHNDVVDPQGPSVRLARLAWKLHPWLNPNSALYFLMDNAFQRLQMAIRISSYEALMREHALRTEGKLHRLIEMPRRHNLPVGMVLWPHPGEGGIDFARRIGLVDQVLAVCAEHEITCLDLEPALSAAAVGDRLIVSRFENHPNAWANALASEAVLATFGPVWQAAAQSKRAVVAGLES
jgi:hypothetical protein